MVDFKRSSKKAAELEISTAIERIDFALAHQWLSTTYWSRGISRRKVEQGFRNSTAVAAAFSGTRMVGIARCVSDTTRFGYIADVFVDDEFRGRGVARNLVSALLRYRQTRDVEHWYLFTKDAHGVYRKLGFRAYDKPERLMHLRS